MSPVRFRLSAPRKSRRDDDLYITPGFLDSGGGGAPEWREPHASMPLMVRASKPKSWIDHSRDGKDLTAPRRCLNDEDGSLCILLMEAQEIIEPGSVDSGDGTVVEVTVIARGNIQNAIV